MGYTFRDVKVALSRFSLKAGKGAGKSALMEVQEPSIHLNVLIPSKLGFVFAERDEAMKLRFRGDGQAESQEVFCFSTDMHRRYSPYASDFGPVNLAIVYRFCRVLSKHLDSAEGMLVYCIEPNPEAIANACFLLGACLVLLCNHDAKSASQYFINTSSPCPLIPFRDASSLPQDYDLALFDCLSGLVKAVEAGWLDLRDFNLDQYELLDSSIAGGIHQICPKLVAFKGPLDVHSTRRVRGEIACPPEHFVPIFHKLGVSCVIRLNEPDTYDKEVFENAGIRHYDLHFDDHTVPSDALMQQFLRICDDEGTVAVHCRAGLGRTGTLIATWMMKHAAFSANEAIAWLRIVRPGSVIGPQQHYLKALERAAAGYPEVPVRASCEALPPPALAQRAALCSGELGEAALSDADAFGRSVVGAGRRIRSLPEVSGAARSFHTAPIAIPSRLRFAVVGAGAEERASRSAPGSACPSPLSAASGADGLNAQSRPPSLSRVGTTLFAAVTADRLLSGTPPADAAASTRTVLPALPAHLSGKSAAQLRPSSPGSDCLAAAAAAAGLPTTPPPRAKMAGMTRVVSAPQLSAAAVNGATRLTPTPPSTPSCARGRPAGPLAVPRRPM